MEFYSSTRVDRQAVGAMWNIRFLVRAPSHSPTRDQDFFFHCHVDKMTVIKKSSILDEIEAGCGVKPEQVLAAILNVKPVPTDWDAKVLVPVVSWPSGTIDVEAYTEDVKVEDIGTKNVKQAPTKIWSRTLKYDMSQSLDMQRYFPPCRASVKKWNAPDQKGQSTAKWTREQMLSEKWAFSSRKYPSNVFFSDDYAIALKMTTKQVLGEDGTPLAYFVDRCYAWTQVEVYLDLTKLLNVRSDGQSPSTRVGVSS